MGTGDCLSPEMLEAFHFGRLPESVLEEVASHLETCPRCESLAGRFDKNVDSVLLAIRSPASEPPAAPEPPKGTTEVDPSQAYPFLRPPQSTEEIGRLGNFRVRKLLGSGGMGYVFDAEDLLLQRPVALKVMKPDLAADADAWQRFVREAQLTASIQHRHLATVFETGQENAVLFLAMERLQGESLATRLERTPRLEVAELLRIGREIAVALCVIHRRGLIHRDIKPDNIWLEAPGANVKVLDLGVARYVNERHRLTRRGMVMGTPAYMSPEQARGQDLDARSDLFALGALLYRAASGQDPFSAGSAMGVMAAVAMATPRPLQELAATIPPRLAQLINRLLAKDVRARPSTADAVVRELEEIEAELTRGPEPRASAKPSRRPRRVASTVGLMVAAALVLGGAIGWNSMRRSPAGPTEPIVHNPPPEKPAEIDPESHDVFLTDLTPVAKHKWYQAPPHLGSQERSRVSVRDKHSPHGIFMHGPPLREGGGPGSVTYSLGGKYRTFRATVSLNDGPRRAESPITFSVYGDGKKLWSTPRPVFSQDDEQSVELSVENVDLLKLEMSVQGAVHGAHAVWIEPRVSP